MLVVAVRFLHAAGGASIALVTGRASELFRIMRSQQFLVWMTDKGLRVLIRLLARTHRSGSDLERFARAHMAGFASVDDVRVGHVNLHNLRFPQVRLILQTFNLL